MVERIFVSANLTKGQAERMKKKREKEGWKDVVVDKDIDSDMYGWSVSGWKDLEETAYA